MNDPLVLKVKRLRPDAQLPTKAFPDDAAWDLYLTDSTDDVGETCVRLPTGIAAEIPVGWYAQILTRSSMAQQGFSVLGGVIDSTYRGEWIVTLWVPPPARYCFRAGFVIGDRIAQFVLLRVPSAVVIEVDELAPSDRGEGGFGSSGK